LVEDSIASTSSFNITAADWTLTTTGGGQANEARAAVLLVTGTPGTTRSIFAPKQSKVYVVVNNSNSSVVLKGGPASPTTGATVLTGVTALVVWNTATSDFVVTATGVTSLAATSPVNASASTGSVTVSLASGYGDTQNPYASKTANFVLAAPDGSAGVPTFRAVVAADIPTLNQNTTGTAANVTGTVAVANGGTGQTSYTDGQILIGNTTGNTLAKSTLTAGSGINITNGSGAITIASSVTAVTSVTGTSPVASSGGTTPAISLAASYGDTQNPYASKTANFVLAAPDGSAGVPTFRAVVAADIPTLNQNTTGTASNVTGTVAIANGGTGQTTANAAFNALVPSQTSNSGKYLTTNGTNTSWATVSGGGGGTVTSVDVSGGSTGLTTSGGPVTSSGTITLAGTLAVANGGTGATTTATARTNLGSTTVGGNLFTLTNPSAVTFPRFNADNTVSALSNSAFRTAIGAGTGDGTVTSVTGTSPVASSGGATPAISLSSGYGDTQNPYASKTANFFLAAPNGSSGAPTFRAVVAADIPTLNQNTTGTASNVTGTVAVANGGTGQTTYTNGQLLIGNTTGNTLTKATLTAGTGISVTNGTGSITIASTTTGTVTSIIAGSGLTGGTITTTGTIALDYYTGSSDTNTSFPIGSYLNVNGGPTARNSSATLYYDNTLNSIFKTSSSGGTALSGTWRARGTAILSISCTDYNVNTLFQRTA
jgi:hypothetical protein